MSTQRLRVFLAITMDSNPGRAVVAACLDTRSPTPRLLRVDGPVTNVHAYWLALDLALSRLAGRPAEVCSNSTGLGIRYPYNTRAPYALPFYELANECMARMARTGTTHRHIHTKSGPKDTREADCIRWLSIRAQEEMAAWNRMEA